MQVYFAPMQESIEHIRAGKLRPLAVCTANRLATLPEVPTLGEFLPGFEASGWNGIGVPKGTSPDIIGTLNREINAGLANAAIKSRFADLARIMHDSASFHVDAASPRTVDRSRWIGVI
jgi:tripartite-type tricarboxylate transporter receptor subunit TctC